MKDTIITGALLHDIGKLNHRGLQENNSKKECRHQELGAWWAEEEGLLVEISTIIQRHHCPKKDDIVDCYSGEDKGLHNCLKVVYVADNIASGMERGEFDTKKGQIIEEPALKSIFTGIAIENKQEHTNIWEPQNIKNFPYPVNKDSHDSKKYSNFYHEQWENFKKEFKSIKNYINEDTLLTLLQKYTLMVPENTLVTESDPPDTSLYHHLKSTAAIAWCIYKFCVDEAGEDWNNKDLSAQISETSDCRFLLIAGDLSGIQDFIYTITTKAALKTVRARSFYLELLSECVISHLVEELDLCRSCIVYNSGGGFYLLAPNTIEIKEKIKQFEKSFNKFLLDKFGFKLFVALAYEPLTGKELQGKGTRLGEIWSDLKQKLGDKKGKKWQDYFEENFEKVFKAHKNPDSCEACHQPLDQDQPEVFDEDNVYLCSFCSTIVQLGKKLRGATELWEVIQPAGFYITIYGHFYAFEKPQKENIKCKYNLQNLWDVAGSSECPVRNLPFGSYITDNQFIELAKKATGLQKLGTLRMDVDLLGQIFSRGLGEQNTFTRLNDLSERINLYFKYYLPNLLHQKTGKNITRIPREGLMVNLIYAGGDDLFLVGTWDSALDAACLIYSDFRKFTGYNPDITLSGGLTVADEKVAFYRIAEASGSEEKKAKSNGRDSFSIFSIPMKWQEVFHLKNTDDITLEDLLQILTSGVSFSDNKCKPAAFSKSFLHNLINITYYYFRSISDLGERYWAFPRIHYLMARSMADTTGKKYKNNFYRPLLSVMLNEKVLEKQMLPALQITDYLTRGGSE